MATRLPDTGAGGPERLRGPGAARGVDPEAPVFVISVAAELAGMHAQTLRQYDRLGLVTPSRTRGGGRRYSTRDVERLREVQRLSQEEGVSLAGVQRIMHLENERDALESRLEEALVEVDQLREALRLQREALAPAMRVFAAGRGGQAVAMEAGRRPERAGGGPLVLWRPRS